jgi:phage baseplate assembly protein W
MSADPALTTRTDHVGRGWSFPLELTSGGSFRLVSGAAELDAAIRLILGTRPGERVLRPDFGCAMWAQTFAPLTDSTVGLVVQAVREAVERWEPRVDLEQVHGEPDHEQACIAVTVEYRVRATNDHRSLVYPFYVIPREGHGP